ncbi:hypothetical protein QJS10_CPB13g00712 [Acorus calamus]|uniref:Uncharacterized protein n=1 Tax=Acorus calamus TaxID=4465 RepID=A0AAV9DI45_ACOCL|nr:hypothetical protein QJS10_CPB13g00712 [Acorus calamus]
MKNHHFIFIVSFTAIAAALTSNGLSLLAFKFTVSDPLSNFPPATPATGPTSPAPTSPSPSNLSGYLPSEITGLSFLHRLNEEGPLSEVVAVFHVAMACVEVDLEARPRMKAVCDGLET